MTKQQNVLKKSMAYNILTSPKAEVDIEQAVEWYVDINIELAQQFVAELKAVKNYQIKL